MTACKHWLQTMGFELLNGTWIVNCAISGSPETCLKVL